MTAWGDNWSTWFEAQPLGQVRAHIAQSGAGRNNLGKNVRRQIEFRQQLLIPIAAPRIQHLRGGGDRVLCRPGAGQPEIEQVRRKQKRVGNVELRRLLCLEREQLK